MKFSLFAISSLLTITACKTSASKVSASESMAVDQKQILSCQGELTNEDGFSDGDSHISLTILAPNAESLKDLSESQATQRLSMKIDLESASFTKAKIQDNYFTMSLLTPSIIGKVFMPVSAIGKTGKFDGVKVRFETGGGMDVGNYSCDSRVE